METWILMADEAQASLVVRSAYGPVYEIENWRRGGDSPGRFAQLVAGRLQALHGHFDWLVLAASPTFLDFLCAALSPEVRDKLAARAVRYMTHLSQRELRQELQELCPA